MRATAMPGGRWGRLIRERRKQAIYRITLLVRGKEVVKEFDTEGEYRKWKSTYEEQLIQENSGIESLRASIVYR